MTDSTQPSAARRPSIGIIAVQFGLISQQQLMECLDLQRGDAADKDLDQILIDRGLLTRDAIDKLITSYDESVKARAAAPPRDSLTGRSTKPITRVGTSGVKPGTGNTGVRRGTEGAPVRRGTGTRMREDDKVLAAHRKHVVTGAILALLPLAALGGYLVYSAIAPEAPARPGPGGGSQTKGPQVVDDTPAPPRPDPGERIVAVLKPLTGRGEIVERWNRIVERVNAARDPEQYKPMLDEMSRLVTEAKGTAFEPDVRAGYSEVIRAMTRRGEQVFAFISDESKRLSEAGRFGEAVKAWDWFPGNLDATGQLSREIERLKQATLETGRRQYQAKRAQAEKYAGEKKFPEAKLEMLACLEMGMPEFADDAYQLVSKYTELEDAAARAAEEKELEEFTKKSRAEREISQRVTTVRGQFWELVSKRKFDQVAPFLGKQREGAPPELGREVDLLEKAFDSVKVAFTAVENDLARRRGQQVTVSFVDGVKSLRLKEAERGRITYIIEGREFTASLYDLAAAEIARAAGEQKDESRREFLAGVASLLSEDFTAAHESLQRSKGEGAPLLAFVEKSTAFLTKNAPEYKARAQRHMEAKEWDKAAAEWSRLVGLPSERKTALRGRARAWFNAGNFVGTVTDIEHLFELDDFSPEVIDLLNQSYQRATLIEKAVQLYEAARAKHPENAAVLGSLMLLYLRKHEYAKARDVLSKVERIQGGMTRELAQAVHALQTLEENPFSGTVHKAQWDRYDLVTNVSQKYANEMAQFMGKVYKEYEKVFPPSRFPKNKNMRFLVKIFAAEAEFFAYCRKGGMNPVGPYGKVLAFYNPTLKELVGWNQQPIAELHETMTHEGLHQFIDYFVDDCPIWFNEGYASYFEKSTATEPRFNKERHWTAQGLLASRQLPRLKQLMLMDRGTFQAAGALHYGSSWSIVYYLIKTGQKALLDRYFEELMQGKTQQQAFDAVFAKIDLDALETRWRRAIFEQDYDR